MSSRDSADDSRTPRPGVGRLGMVSVETAAAGVAAVAAGALTLYATSRHGPGVSPDSAAYLSLASNLAEGRGLTAYTGQPVSEFPPIYPLLLTGLSSITGAEVLTAARALNAVALAAIVLTGSILLRRHVHWPWLRLMGVAGLASAPPLIAVGSWAWSEPVFIALSIGAIASMERALVASRATRWVVAAGLLAALCFATRYIGISLAIAGVGALLVAGERAPWRTRARDAALFSGVFALGASVVIVRNLTAASTAFGARETADVSFPDVARLGALLVLVAVALGVAYARRGEARAGSYPLAPLTLFVLAYVVVLETLAATTQLDPIDARLLSPLFVPGLVLALSFADRIARSASPATLRLRRAAIMSLVALYTGASIAHGVGNAHDARSEGGQYDRPAWQSSPLAKRLKIEHNGGVIYTDAPDAVWATTRLEARCLPPQIRAPCSGLPGVSSDRDSLQEEDEALLAWFTAVGAPQPPLERLSRVVHVRQVAARRDGTLYRLTPRR